MNLPLPNTDTAFERFLQELPKDYIEVTDKHQGAHLGHYPLQAGDVVVMDRAYNQTQALIEQADQGLCVVLRYNPHSLNV